MVGLALHQELPVDDIKLTTDRRGVKMWLLALLCLLNVHNSLAQDLSLTAGCIRNGTEPADIVFLLDASVSIGQNDFDFQKQFVKDIVRAFPIASDEVLIGIVIFSDYPLTIIKLANSTNNVTLYNAIDNIPYLAQATATAEAIQYVMQNSFTPEAGDRDDARNILVVITDGTSNNKTAALAVAANLQQTNITTLAIGVGGLVDNEELSAIASDPRYVFNVSEYQALSTLQGYLAETACPSKVDGGWGLWSNWTACTQPCGGGSQFRDRQCDNPPPSFGGQNCSGNSTEVRLCNTEPCATQTPEGCGTRPADIVFLLDASRSIHSKGFEQQKQFLKDIVSSFTIGPKEVQFGIVAFSDAAETIIDLINSTDKQSVLDALDRIPHLQRSTSTSDALLYVTKNSFTAEAGDRDGAENILIVITDGSSNNKTATLAASAALHQQKIKTFAIGVGSLIDKEELSAIASEDRYRFNVSSYQTLSTLQGELTQKTCIVNGGWGGWSNWTTCTRTCGGGTQYAERKCNNPPPSHGGRDCVGSPKEVKICNPEECIEPVFECTPKPADIVFLLDASGSIGNDSFQRLREFVSTYVDIFPIGTSDVEIGAVIFSDQPQLIFNLNNFTDKSNLTDAINKIPYTLGTTNTADALEYVLENSFTNASGDRPDVVNVLVVITDGESNNKSQTIQMGKKLQGSNMTVYAIGVGAGVDFTELNAIATDDNHVFNVSTYDALTNLRGELSRAACIVNGSWSEWTDWSQCSVTCGDGSRVRIRECSNPRPTPGGQQCEGPSRETMNCSLDACPPVDGNWSVWSNWSVCTQTCDGGTQFRDRQCDNPPPSLGGLNCTGNSTEVRVCNTEQCCGTRPADIVFLLDASRSITSEGFEQQKQFLKDIVSSFTIGPKEVQFGIVAFSDAAETIINLINSTDKQSVIDALDRIPHLQRSTATSDALLYVIKNSFTAEAGDRDGADNILIVITDGSSNNKTATLAASAALHKQKMKTFAIGVGKLIDKEELSAIASEDRYRLNVSSYQTLSTLQEELTQKTCAVNGGWTQWFLPWSLCTRTCGGGTQYIERKCTNPPPSYGGKDCVGNPTEVRICNPEECPTMTLPEYIEKYLDIKVTILNNLKFDGKYHNIEITFTNTGNMNLALGGIPINLYLYSYSMLEPDHLPAKGGYRVPGQNITLSHVKGSLFSIQPTDSFGAMSVNESVTVKLLAKGNSVAKSDIPPNWYAVIENSKPFLISSTMPGKSFVTDFKSTNQWKRWRNDRYNPFTSEQRYQRFATTTGAENEKTLIPTPKYIRMNTDKRVDINNFTIYATANLQNEAKYLAGKLHLNETVIVKEIPYQRENSILLWTDPENFHILKSPEGYSLEVTSQTQSVSIKGMSSAGVFYGIQSLLSFFDGPDGFNVTDMTIFDEPRYEYRGVQLDLGHSFHQKEEILKLIKAMAMYKMNKLHLHLSDDEGWRLEIPGLPELTEVGSQRCHDLNETTCLLPQFGSGPDNTTSGSGYLTVQDYQEIVQYAESLHIEVIPEIDVPGHSRAAVRAMEVRYNRLKESNYTEAIRYRLVEPSDHSVYLSPHLFDDNTMNPCIPSTYAFIQKVISEIKIMQPSLRVFHMGGDEIPKGAWTNSSSCRDLANSVLHFPDLRFAQEFFLQNISSFTQQKRLQLGAWEEMFQDKITKEVINRDKLSNHDVYVYIWNNVKTQKYAYNFANDRFKVIMSHATHLYFDIAQEPNPDERGSYFSRRFTDTKVTFGFMPENLYSAIDEKITGEATSKEELCGNSQEDCPSLKTRKNLSGLEGSIWSETMYSDADLDYMVYPRLLALAERAWHHAEWEDIADKVTRDGEMQKDWESFARIVGNRELRRLDSLGVKYRLAPPGGRTQDGIIQANAEFPGTPIEISEDKGKTWMPFTNNYTVTHPGVFLLRTTSIVGHRNSPSISLNPMAASTTSAVFNGSFTSKNYPNSYPSNLYQQFDIKLGSGNFDVDINFKDFDLEQCVNCTCDFVEVQSVNTLPQRFCGNSTQSVSLSNVTDYVWLFFRTNSQVEHSGFSVSYSVS